MATPFTPWLGALGGALIGVAAALLLLTNGRVAGISGILGRALVPETGDFAWRAVFLIGLLLGAAGGTLLTHDVHGFEIMSSTPTLIAAGLLVGFGTALGNGCTSGHGVCGMARGSRRSIVATAVFMGSAILAEFVIRHGFGAG